MNWRVFGFWQSCLSGGFFAALMVWSIQRDDSVGYTVCGLVTAAAAWSAQELAHQIAGQPA